MRILIVSTFFPPLNAIASLRPYSWAKEWAREGHEVTVLTTAKDQDPAVSLKLAHGCYKLLEIPLPKFLRQAKSAYAPSSSTRKSAVKCFFEWMRQRLGIFNACRMPDFTDLWIRPALQAVKTEPPYDVVVSTAGPYSVHILAYLLKKRGQATRWVADYRDNWSDNVFYGGLFPLNLVEKMLERQLLRLADAITTISPPFTESFKKKYRRQSVSTVFNGFDPEDLTAIDAAPAFPKDGRVRIVHTGSIYLGRRDPSPLFQALSELNRVENRLFDRLEIIFVGVNQANLQTLIDRYQVSQWVKIEGFVAREKALAMQRDADALLFLPWNDPKVDGVVTGKIFEYLFSKTPILAIGASHMELSQQMILEAKAGKALHSLDQIKTYLLDLLHQTEKRSSSIEDSFLRRYDRKIIAQNFLMELEMKHKNATCKPI